jgi:hypothetical protein
MVGEQLDYTITVTPTTSVEMYTIAVKATGVSQPLALTEDSNAEFRVTWNVSGQKTITATVENGFDMVKTSLVVEITELVLAPGDENVKSICRL